jgi:hypothetical protein
MGNSCCGFGSSDDDGSYKKSNPEKRRTRQSKPNSNDDNDFLMFLGPLAFVGVDFLADILFSI